MDIKGVGSSDFFYSEPSSDGEQTLDDKISDAEQRIAPHVQRMRDIPVGDSVAASVASETVFHLAPRAAHLREAFAFGVQRMAEVTTATFTDPSRFRVYVGLDQAEPSERFLQHASTALDDTPGLQAVGLPRQVLERVAFYLAKENFDTAFGQASPWIAKLLAQLAHRAPQIARDGHIKALHTLPEHREREEFLKGLSWKIQAGPIEGAILPDCVALASTKDGTIVPYMFASSDEVRAVVLPISSKKLLVGSIPGSSCEVGFDFNSEAARCSHAFYLASTHDERMAGMHSLIGELSASLLGDVTSELFQVVHQPVVQNSRTMIGDGSPEPEPSAQTTFGYEISCFGAPSENKGQELAAEINRVVEALAKAIPVRRLHGITIAADYPAAVREFDRGLGSIEAPESTDPEIGVGIARLLLIKRDERVMGRILIDNSVAYALIGDDDAQDKWARHLLIYMLVKVAMIEWVERCAPGYLLEPIPDNFRAQMFEHVRSALDSYVASRLSAQVGDAEDVAAASRNLFVRAIQCMRGRTLEARYAYRTNGDLDCLLALALANISDVLRFAADLAGHSAALKVSPFDSEGELQAALSDAGLTAWFDVFQSDLNKFGERIGVWTSFDEFLGFSVHVERLLWQLGMFPWQTEGGLRVEIPLVTDAAALISQYGDDEHAPPPALGFGFKTKIVRGWRLIQRLLRASLRSSGSAWLG